MVLFLAREANASSKRQPGIAGLENVWFTGNLYPRTLERNTEDTDLSPRFAPPSRKYVHTNVSNIYIATAPRAGRVRKRICAEPHGTCVVHDKEKSISENHCHHDANIVVTGGTGGRSCDTSVPPVTTKLAL